MFNLTTSGNLVKDAVADSINSKNGLIYSIKIDLAVNKKMPDGSKITTYLKCVYWCKSDKIVQYLKKGTAVNVLINWFTNQKEQNGDRYFHEFRISEIEFQASKPKELGVNQQTQTYQQQPNRFDNPNNVSGDIEDDLPF